MQKSIKKAQIEAIKKFENNLRMKPFGFYRIG